jgi:hypothetical protein
MKRVKILEEKIDTKVDCDAFDNEIASIRELIGNIESDGNNQPI